MTVLRSALSTLRPLSRTLSLPSLTTSSLDTWTASALSSPLSQTDSVSLTTALQLHYTLPTRSGPIYSTPAPLPGSPLPQGHHAVLFPPLFPEAALNADGTEPAFSPPPPWTRRMWAAGKMVWSAAGGNELRIGDAVQCESVVERVERKGWDTDRPKVFVWQRREISNAAGLALTEHRAHVYQPPVDPSSPPPHPAERADPELPDPDFSIRFTPTVLTLFRFSALTFNAHRIHYDPTYASSVHESHPERLVHAPLTALLLLENVNFNLPPQGRIKAFEYRATRPIAVGEEVTFAGAWKEGPNRNEIVLWAVNGNGQVAMIGEAVVDGLLG